jgi:hypothetical protein
VCRTFGTIAAGFSAVINVAINVAPDVKHMLLIVANDELDISLSLPSFPSVSFVKNHINSK